jgi:hypothetical protein
MFNLNFDICLVPSHAILTEITVFKLKQTFLEPPRISWKGPIKTNWITATVFLRLLFQLVGWFDEVSCRSGSKLCWKKSRQERVLQLIETSLCAIEITPVWSTIWESFVKRLLQHAATTNDPKFVRLYDFTGKTLHSCWGTCIYWWIWRLFLNHNRELDVLTIKYNTSQHKLLHVVCINI